MNRQTLFHIIPSLISICLSTYIGLFALRRQIPGSKSFGYMALAQTAWLVGYALELTSTSLDGKIFWDNVQWIFAYLIPLAFLSFSLQYAGRETSRLRRLFGIFSVPVVIFILLLFTNDLHGLTMANPRLIVGVPFDHLSYDFPPLVIGFSLFFYGLVIAGITTLLAHLFRSPLIVRIQIITVILGGLIPVVGSILTLAGLIPNSIERDISPYTFAMGNIVIGWALFRYQMLNVAPLARNFFFDNMHEGFIVLDETNRIVDINPAATEIIGVTGIQAIGNPAKDILSPWPGLLERIGESVETREMITVGVGEGKRYFDVLLSPLNDPLGRIAGCIITLRSMDQGFVQPFHNTESVGTVQKGNQPKVRDEADHDFGIENILGIRTSWGVWLLSFFYPAPQTDLFIPKGREPFWHQTLERIFTAILRLGVLMLLVMVVLLKPVYINFPQAYLTFEVLIMGLAVLAAFRSIPFGIRSAGFLFIFYLFGIVETITFGFTAESFTFFLIVVVAAGILTLGRTRMVIMTIFMTTIAIFGFEVAQENILPLAGSQIHLTAYQAARTIPTLIAFMAVITGLSTVTTLIWEIARQSWLKEKQVSNLLQQERDLLDQRVQERSHELSEAEAKYRLLVNQLPSAIYQSQADSKAANLYFSPKIEQLLGYSLQEWEQDPLLWHRIVHPEDYEHVKESIKKTLHQGFASNEYRLYNSRGGVVWVRDDAVLIKDGSGQPLYIQGVISDITIRKLALQRQHESEDLMAHVMGNINEVFWITDPSSGKELYISPSSEKVWGVNAEELIKAPNLFMESVIEQDRPKVVSALEKQARGESTEMEYRIARSDGTTRWVWDRSFVLFDEAGNVDRVAGFATDITELRQAQSDLEILARQYENLFEQSPVSLWEEDFSEVKKKLDDLRQQGVSNIAEYLDQHPEFVAQCAETVRIVNVNEATREMYRAKDKSELLGNLLQLFNQQNLAGFKAELLNIVKGTTRFSTVIENYTITGERMDVNITWSVMAGYEDTLSRVIVSINNITSELEAQKTLQRQNEEYAALSRIAIDLLNRRSLDELLKTAVEQAAFLLDAPYCELMLKEGETLVVRSFTDNQPFLKGDAVDRNEAKVSWQAHDTGKPVIIDDYSAWAAKREIYADIHHLHATADFPIIAGDHCIGVLAVGRDRSGYSFSEHQIHLGQWLTQLLALILDNAQLLETTRLQVSALRATANAIVITDRSGIIQWVNPAFTSLTGYSIQDAIGQNPRILQSGRTPKHLYKDLWSSILSGWAWSGEVINRRKDGTEYIEEMTITPFSDEHGNINRFIAVKQDITLRKQVEQALKENEERYRSVVTALSEGVVLQDQSGSIIAYNQAAESILGLTKDQLMGKKSIDTDWRSIHVDGLPFPGDAHPAIYTLKTGEPQSNVIMGVHKPNGTLTWISINTQPIWGEGTDLPSAVVASFTDITERKLADDLLRDSEERYRLIYENIDDVVYQTDYHGKITAISPSIEKQGGYQPEEVIGKHADFFYSVPSEYAALDTLFQMTGSVNDYELRLKRKDGSQIYVSLTGRTIFNENGQPVGTEGVMRNITERKLVEERIVQANIELENRVLERTAEIQTSNKYLSALLETSITLNKNLDLDELLDHILTRAHAIIACRAVNIMLVDGDQAYIARRLGYMGLENLERNLMNYRYPLSWPTFNQMTSTRAGISLGDTIIDPNWQNIASSEWVRSYIGLPLLVRDTVIGFLNFSHDQPDFFSQKDFNLLTAFANHASVAIQNARLLDEVKRSLEKEKDLRDKLVHADKLVALGKMVAVIAHEINNPIQTVKNTFYLLEDQVAPDSPASEYLKIASLEATRISDLVTQLREAYRPRSKKFTLVNTTHVLKEVHMLLAPQMKKNQVECSLNEADRPCMVLAIQDNLKQVFINLCMNALEAMSAEKTGKIDIHYNFDLKQNMVGIEIHNTGPLIPQEDLDHLFEPFFTTKGLGSGLGLSICFDIIKQHSGEITVRNIPETGVTFTVWLPLAMEQDQELA